MNYHVASPGQRWAYDLLVTRDRASHRGDGRRCEDYYIYDRPVRAPAGGTVRAIADGDPDMPIGQLGGGHDPGGNQIVLDVAPGEFLFLCHLKPGSIQVAPGEAVVEGQELARVGNSGNTSEPHLHVHLQDSPNLLIGEGIPLEFSDYRSGNRLVRRGMPRGGFDGGKLVGEVVEHVGSTRPRPPERPRDDS